ncbi:MAG: hypothetical protein AMS25_19110 [Gemmatimonas sp. SM23_52]|nr:MAG: hypothetical protein AMS25_19110 [Gemmatimonas sp. SM23_52]
MIPSVASTISARRSLRDLCRRGRSPTTTRGTGKGRGLLTDAPFGTYCPVQTHSGRSRRASTRRSVWPRLH